MVRAFLADRPAGARIATGLAKAGDAVATLDAVTEKRIRAVGVIRKLKTGVRIGQTRRPGAALGVVRAIAVDETLYARGDAVVLETKRIRWSVARIAASGARSVRTTVIQRAWMPIIARRPFGQIVRIARAGAVACIAGGARIDDLTAAGLSGRLIIRLADACPVAGVRIVAFRVVSSVSFKPP